MVELLSTIRDVATHLDMRLLCILLAIMVFVMPLLFGVRLESEKARNRINLRERTRAEAAIAFARSLERSTSARTFLILYEANFTDEMQVSFPEWKPFLDMRIAAALEDA